MWECQYIRGVANKDKRRFFPKLKINKKAPHPMGNILRSIPVALDNRETGIGKSEKYLANHIWHQATNTQEKFIPYVYLTTYNIGKKISHNLTWFLQLNRKDDNAMNNGVSYSNLVRNKLSVLKSHDTGLTWKRLKLSKRQLVTKSKIQRWPLMVNKKYHSNACIGTFVNKFSSAINKLAVKICWASKHSLQGSRLVIIRK